MTCSFQAPIFCKKSFYRPLIFFWSFVWLSLCKLFCDQRVVSINLWRQSPGSLYTIVWLLGNSPHRLNPEKSSSMFVLLHIWKVRVFEDLYFSWFYVAMNSFSTLLLIHLDRGDSGAYFEKKVVQSDEVQQRCYQNTKRLIYSDTSDSTYKKKKQCSHNSQR